MKKHVLLLSILTLVGVTSLVSCDNTRINTEIKEDVNDILISFIVDGQTYKVIKIKENEKCEFEDEPTKTGYKFIGWFTESDGKGVAFKSGDTFSESKTFYAYFEEDIVIPEPPAIQNALIDFNSSAREVNTPLDSKIRDYVTYDGLDNFEITSSGVYGSSAEAIRLGTGKLLGNIKINFKEQYFNHLVFSLSQYNKDAGSSLKVVINDKITTTITGIGTEFKDFVVYSDINISSIEISNVTVGKRVNLDKISLLTEEVKVKDLQRVIGTNEVYINEAKDVSSLYKIIPSDATIKDVNITSTDNDVNINGTLVTCLSLGEHTIKVTSVANSSASCEIILTCINKPEEIVEDKIENPRFTNIDYYHTGGMSVTPSTGNVNILVVPVDFSDKTDFTWSNLNLTKLNGALNGDNAENSNSYWESLKSYYYKSSYGKLNLTSTICDVFTPSFTAANFIDGEAGKTSSNSVTTGDLISEFKNNGKLNGSSINWANYDSDKDGYVDGIWFIYDNNEISYTYTESDGSPIYDFWAYTSWYNDNEYSSTNTYICPFANMSASFLFDGYNSNGYDAHTLIHETGHLMGLDDYYSYDANNSGTGGPLMMDNNVGDHDPFSKFALNWNTPYIANAKNKSFKLRSFADTGDCLIIPANKVNSAFSEYLVIDYYTPTGINALDAKNLYSSVYNFKNSGIRVYHVDSRLIQMTYNNGSWTYGAFVSDDATTLPRSNTSYTWPAMSNSSTRSYDSNSCLIELVSSQGVQYKNQSYSKHASSSDFFNVGDEINSTTISKFLKSGKRNNGNTFDYEIIIDSIDETGATITVR